MTKITLNTNEDGTASATTGNPATAAWVLGPADESGKTPVAVQGHGQVIFDDWLCPVVEPKRNPWKNRGKGFGKA
jgi:2-keto-4-pentenoate hydratase